MGLKKAAKKYSHGLNYGMRLPWYKMLLVWGDLWLQRHTGKFLTF